MLSKIRRPSLAILSGIAIFALSCSEEEKEKVDSAAAQNGATAQLELSFSVANAGRDAVALRLTDPSETRFESTSIVSGPPDEMEIYIQKLTLASEDPGTSPLEIFDEPAGRPVRISGSKIDLSELFSHFACRTADGDEVVLAEGETCECGLDSNGTLIQKTEQPVLDDEGNDTGESALACDFQDMEEPPIAVIAATPGTYHSLGVVYSLGARMRGCVGGYFRVDNTAATYNELTHYCTNTVGSYFDTTSDTRASQFLVANPNSSSGDWTMVSLTRNGSSHAGETTDQLNISYPIAGGLELTAGGTAPLTFLIDTNRMLRFENGGRSDRTPVSGTSWTKERAYFFNGVFQDSTFIFAGRAGDIKGYQWNATNCQVDAELGVSRDLDDYNCNVRSGAEERAVWKNVQGWLTIIEDPDGLPFLMSLMPDDDDALTVIKGSNAPAERGDTTPGSNFNPAAFVEQGSNLFNLRFALDDSEGVIYNFPYNLDLNAESSSIKYDALTPELDPTDGESFGKITFSRAL